jgi:coenzyme F420-0:L-glutamate ligase
MQIRAIKTKLFREGAELMPFLFAHLPRLKEGSVVVISSKIVSLSEGRTARLEDRERLIRASSAKAVKTKNVWLTVTEGMLMANAGIDESNGNGRLVLLPKDSYKTAARIRSALMKKYGVKKLGVVIADSVVMPMRKGVVGAALGYAGFKGVKDYKGKKDLYGRKFRFASSNIADSLATSAMLEMGEGDERKPLAVIGGAQVVWSSSVERMSVPESVDMFTPLLRSIKRRK